MRRAVILLAMMGASLAAQPASLEGTVVDQTTGKPLERVHVTLTLQRGDSVYGALSDSKGHFSVTQMSPGQYNLSVERTGYVQSADGARVSLKPGQQLTDLTVKMARAAMLAGRVVDQSGDPVAHINVRMMPGPPTKLSPSLTQGEYGQTDDRGEFHILTGPGKYYLEAEPARGPTGGPPEARSDGSSETFYTPTYYPSAVTRDRAAMVEVTAGHDVEGLEIHLAVAASQRPLSVSGVVTGIPVGNGFTLVYLAGSTEQSIGAPAFVGADGKFSVSGLEPGVYDVTAESLGTKKLLLARTRVKLEATDVTDVELALSEPGELTGTLEMVGGTPAAGPSAEKRKVRLEAAGGNPLYRAGNVSGDVDSDGSFHIANVVPDRFRVVVGPLPETAYIKTLEVDGAAVTDQAIEVYSGHIPRVRITVGLDGASIAGKVLDKDGAELGDGVNVMLLADPEEVMQTAKSEGGKYILQGICPGKYRLIAVEVSEGSDIGKLFDAAEEIEVRPGDRITKDLKLTAMETADAKK